MNIQNLRAKFVAWKERDIYWQAFAASFCATLSIGTSLFTFLWAVASNGRWQVFLLFLTCMPPIALFFGVMTVAVGQRDLATMYRTDEDWKMARALNPIGLIYWAVRGVVWFWEQRPRLA